MSAETRTIRETVAALLERNGAVQKTPAGRLSIQSWENMPRGTRTLLGLKPPTDQQRKWGYIQSVAGKRVLKTATVAQVEAAIRAVGPQADIVEVYPTVFCTHCEAPSWQFADVVRAGHRTCKRCGFVQPIKQEGFSLHLGENGQQNKFQWRHTPGMDASDTALTKRGQRLQLHGQKSKAHLRNYWRIKKKIDEFFERFRFPAAEAMIRAAKAKLGAYYKRIHGCDDHGDNEQRDKLPHGGAALAAACFYVAVLEFEKRTGQQTVCTLPAIAEFAQSLRDVKKNRRTRDVTENVVLKLAKRLERAGYCSANIPEIGAKTLQFDNATAALEHARMAIFGQCQPVRFVLPRQDKWGIKVVDSGQGALCLENVDTKEVAFQRGFRKGDYICEVNRQLVGVEYTVSMFADKVAEIRRQDQRPVVEVTIMRKKKN